MLKKFISLFLICTFLVPFCNITTVSAADPNEVYYSFDFSDTSTGFSGWPRYTNLPSGYSTSGHPSFKAKSDGEVMNFSTFGLKFGTSDPIPYAAGRAYPAATTYENLQLAIPGRTPSIAADYANANQIGYSLKIKFASEKNGYPAGFPKYLKHIIRTGESWTDDFTVWEVDNSGIFKFGSYTKQLSLDTEYSLFVLADQRDTNSYLSLYIDGELQVSTRAMGTTSKNIYKFLYQLNSSETNGSGQCVWKDVDLYIRDVHIYTMTNPNYAEISGNSIVYTDTAPAAYQYSAQSLMGHKGLNWGITPSGEDVTVSSTGLVTVNPTAQNGDYTITASNADNSVSASKTITVQRLTYELDGADTIYVARNKGYQKIAYSVKSSNGDVVSVPISLSGEHEGLKIENNTVKINEAFTGTSFTLNANVGGDALTKAVQVKKTELYDFQSDSSKSGWAAGTGGISNPWAESDGNVYLDSQGTRWESPAIISDPITSGVFTAEFDFLAEANTEGNLMIFSGADNGSSPNEWWGVISKSGPDSFFKYNGISAPSFNMGWNRLKFRFDFDAKELKIYVNDAYTAIPAEKFNYGGATFVNYTFKKIITYMPLDNLCIYSGDAIDYEITSVNAPSVLVIPSRGQTKKVVLDAAVYEDSVQIYDAELEWSIKEPASFASISEGRLIYNENARGSITLVSKIKNTNVTYEKTVSFSQPDVSFTLGADNVLNISGQPDTPVELKIYPPKDTSDNLSRFLEACTSSDGQTPIEYDITLDSSGEESVDLSSLDPGRYRFYADMAGTDLDYDAEIDIKLTSLFDSAANFNSENLDKFLAVHTNATSTEAQKTEQTYRALTGKANAVRLMQKNPASFCAATLAMDFAENDAYNQSDASLLKSELAKLGINNLDFDAVKKNVSYTALMGEISNFTSLEAFSSDINTKAILVGIENVANDGDVAYFLKKLSYSSYDNASEYEQYDIHDQLGGIRYASLQAVKDAIDDILSQGSYGGSGSSGGGGGGGFGGNSFVSADSKDKTDIPENYTYPTETGSFNDVPQEHWAHTYISALSSKNIVNGYNNSYMPESRIKRAEFVKILVEAFGINGYTDHGFDDVDKSQWYYNYIIRAKSNGLILGNNGSFGPEDDISRQDAAVMIYRFARYTGKTFAPSDSLFADNGEIADYAIEAIYSLASQNILSGKGNNIFEPQSRLTRAEAAKIIYVTLYGGEN